MATKDIPTLGPAASLSATDLYPLTQGSAVALKGTHGDLADFVNKRMPVCLMIECFAEVTPVTAGASAKTFRMPFALTLTEPPRATLTTAQATGSILTVNIKESGTTIFSTKITVDNTEKTSKTAAIPAIVSDANLADDAEMKIDVDQVGDGTATGLKIYLIGHLQ